MNAHNTRLIRSVLIIAVGFTLYVTSFWFSDTQYASNPHMQQVGYVDEGANSGDAYYVLTMQNESVVPWLIVAQRFRQQSDIAPFTTEMNSTTEAVTVNGTAYDEIEGQTTVVLSSPEGNLVHSISRAESPTLRMLGRKMGDVRVPDFEMLLPKPRNGEPSDATESR
ncbi:MAG: hypothetical protein R3C53_27975 [Pirellulaceae bacterium]